MRKLLLFPLFLAVGLATWVTLFTNHAYITTPSMYPTIPPGSMVLIQKESSYHVGDVIEFHGDGLDYLHRIIKIGPTGDITTKGDSPQNVPDVFVPPTTKSVVMGKVVFAPQWLGFPELIAHHPSYGLSWLRAELGVRGKVIVVLAAALLAWLLYGPGRRRKPAREVDVAAPDIDLRSAEVDGSAATVHATAPEIDPAPAEVHPRAVAAEQPSRNARTSVRRPAGRPGRHWSSPTAMELSAAAAQDQPVSGSVPGV